MNLDDMNSMRTEIENYVKEYNDLSNTVNSAFSSVKLSDGKSVQDYLDELKNKTGLSSYLEITTNLDEEISKLSYIRFREVGKVRTSESDPVVYEKKAYVPDSFADPEIQAKANAELALYNDYNLIKTAVESQKENMTKLADMAKVDKRAEMQSERDKREQYSKILQEEIAKLEIAAQFDSSKKTELENKKKELKNIQLEMTRIKTLMAFYTSLTSKKEYKTEEKNSEKSTLYFEIIGRNRQLFSIKTSQKLVDSGIELIDALTSSINEYKEKKTELDKIYEEAFKNGNGIIVTEAKEKLSELEKEFRKKLKEVAEKKSIAKQITGNEDMSLKDAVQYVLDKIEECKNKLDPNKEEDKEIINKLEGLKRRTNSIRDEIDNVMYGINNYCDLGSKNLSDLEDVLGKSKENLTKYKESINKYVEKKNIRKEASSRQKSDTKKGQSNKANSKTTKPSNNKANPMSQDEKIMASILNERKVKEETRRKCLSKKVLKGIGFGVAVGTGYATLGLGGAVPLAIIGGAGLLANGVYQGNKYTIYRNALMHQLDKKLSKYTFNVGGKDYRLTYMIDSSGAIVPGFCRTSGSKLSVALSTFGTAIKNFGTINPFKDDNDLKNKRGVRPLFNISDIDAKEILENIQKGDILSQINHDLRTIKPRQELSENVVTRQNEKGEWETIYPSHDGSGIILNEPSLDNLNGVFSSIGGFVDKEQNLYNKPKYDSGDFVNSTVRKNASVTEKQQEILNNLGKTATPVTSTPVSPVPAVDSKEEEIAKNSAYIANVLFERTKADSMENMIIVFNGCKNSDEVCSAISKYTGLNIKADEINFNKFKIAFINNKEEYRREKTIQDDVLKYLSSVLISKNDINYSTKIINEFSDVINANDLNSLNKKLDKLNITAKVNETKNFKFEFDNKMKKVLGAQYALEIDKFPESKMNDLIEDVRHSKGNKNEVISILDAYLKVEDVHDFELEEFMKVFNNRYGHIVIDKDNKFKSDVDDKGYENENLFVNAILSGDDDIVNTVINDFKVAFESSDKKAAIAPLLNMYSFDVNDIDVNAFEQIFNEKAEEIKNAKGRRI